MDEPATATCASSSAVHVSSPPSQAIPTDADGASAEVSAPPTAAVVPSSAAQRPPLGRRRIATTRPRGIVQPRRQPTPRATAATTDDSDDAGSGDATTAPSRNCPTRAQALQEFLACVAAEITELVAAFQTQPCEERCLSTFKALWTERRLSPLFQVEFWDSTPSDTHHAVLQVALELLEDAVLTATQEDDASVWVVLGFCFALYCAFFVQVSDPKIKIAVDVVAWQSLTQLTGLLTRQLTVPQLTDASREALAMLRRLEHEDDAFLKCLGGSVADFRLRPRTHRRLGAGGRQMAALVLPLRREDELEDVVMRLEALSAQYNTALKQLAQVETTVADATSQTTTATANQGGRSSGAGRGRGRGRATPTFLRRTRPNELTSSATNGAGSNFLQEAGLWSGHKATEHELWVVRVRQSLLPTSVNGADQHNLNSGIVRRQRTSQAPMFLDGDGATDDVDAALLALEQELEREEVRVVSMQNAKPPASHKAAAKQRRPPTAQRKPSGPTPDLQSTVPVTRPTKANTAASSGQESDSLDELEAELARDVTGNANARLPAPATSKRVTPSIRAPPVVRSRPRAPSVLSMDTESVGLADLEAELDRDTLPRTLPAQRLTTPVNVPNSRSIMSRTTRSRAMSVVSTAEESDGLEELEAELMRETRRLPQPRNIPARRAIATSADSVGTRPPRATRSRAMSIVSTGEETDGLEELEAELARETQAVPRIPRVATSMSQTVAPPQPAAQATLHTTRKRAFSIVSSGQESDGLTELEAELEQGPQHVAAPPAPRSRNRKQPAAQMKAPPVAVRQQPVAFPATRPPRALPRHSSRFSDVSSVDELNLLQQELDASLTAAPVKALVTRQPAPSRKRPATTSSTLAAPSAKRLAVVVPHETSAVTAAPAHTVRPRRSRRLSDASSVMTESDAELAALQAELTKIPTTKAAETATALLIEPATSRVENPAHRRLRSVSELSATTESDEELKELQAELAKTTQPTVVAEPVKKPRAKAKAKPSMDPASMLKEPRKRAPRSAAKEKNMAVDQKATAGANPIQKPKTPRKPRQSKAITAKVLVQQAPLPKATEAASTQKPPLASAPVVASRSTRFSSRRSVASSYDSDGLDELENELRAFQ